MSILEIQKALNAAGFGPLVEDGIDGPKTHAALLAFQQAHGIAPGSDFAATQAALGGGSAPTTGASAQATFQEKYPAFAWAFNDPEVAKVLNDAVANKWGPDEVQNAIMGTNWWKSKTDAERSWLQLDATNPTEAVRRLNNYDSITKYMALAADYGMPVDFQGAARQVDRVVRGEVAPDALNEELRMQAKALYPQLSQQIDAGSTVADIYAPYKQIATQLLGVNPEAIRLTDPKWQQPLQFHSKDGTTRLATTDEWMTQLRQDPRFGYDTSTNGRTEASQLAAQLQQKFGIIG